MRFQRHAKPKNQPTDPQAPPHARSGSTLLRRQWMGPPGIEASVGGAKKELERHAFHRRL